MHHQQDGFTLIELMVSVSIVGLLMAVSIPTYSTYRNQAALTVAKVDLQTGLNDFSIKHDFSPATGMLADLVSEGSLRTIPNDPWTAQSKRITGAEEVGDWFYENDGKKLIFYALSHPGNIFELASLGLPPIQQGVMPLVKIKQLDLTQVKGADILALTPAELALLTPEQIAMMSAADFNKLTLEQKAVLTQAQVDERAFADGVRGMKLWQFGDITTNQAKYLTVEQIASVPHDWWFNKIPQASRDAMNKEQIQAFIPNAFRNGRVGTLTAAQRDWLTPTQVQGLAQDNFQYLSISQFALVTAKQIGTVPHDWWFNKIPQATRDSMTQAQVQAFNSNAFRNGRVATLTPAQRDWLTPTQIQGLTQDNFKSLSSGQFAQVTAQQVASIPNDWWFNKLPQATRNTMTQAQVNAIPASYYAKIKASLSAQQQSWRP